MKANEVTGVKKGYSRCKIQISKTTAIHDDDSGHSEMMITWFDGDGGTVEQTLSWWAKKLGYSFGYLRRRIRNLPLEEAMKPETDKSRMKLSSWPKKKKQILKVLPSGITEVPPLTLRR